MTRYTQCAAALVTMLPLLAMANDGVAGVSAGGIVFRKTDVIAMKKEVLNVSNDLISVDYEFLNQSPNAVEETIVFPLPAYPAASRMFDSYYGQPAGFLIRVDGQPVNFTTRLVALSGKRDVTADLKNSGLSEAQIAHNDQFESTSKVTPMSATQRGQLKKIGLFGELPDGEQGPLWEIQVNYIWKQTFPADKVVRVHHEYRPFYSTGAGESQMDKDFAKTYCADKDFFGAYNKLVARNSNPYLNVAKISYILKTGNTWKNGIEDFTLNVIKRNPAELISLCFPGTFKKIDARTYQVRILNFRPNDNLNVYFGNIDSDGMYLNHGVMPVLKK